MAERGNRTPKPSLRVASVLPSSESAVTIASSGLWSTESVSAQAKTRVDATVTNRC